MGLESGNCVLIFEFTGLLLCAACLSIYGYLTIESDFVAGNVKNSDVVYLIGMVLAVTCMGTLFCLLHAGIKQRSPANLFVWHMTRGVAALLGIVVSGFLLARASKEGYEAFVLITIVNVYLILSMVVVYLYSRFFMPRPGHLME